MSVRHSLAQSEGFDKQYLLTLAAVVVSVTAAAVFLTTVGDSVELTLSTIPVDISETATEHSIEAGWGIDSGCDKTPTEYASQTEC